MQGESESRRRGMLADLNEAAAAADAYACSSAGMIG
jgi:hypothetical protein